MGATRGFRNCFVFLRPEGGYSGVRLYLLGSSAQAKRPSSVEERRHERVPQLPPSDRLAAAPHSQPLSSRVWGSRHRTGRRSWAQRAVLLLPARRAPATLGHGQVSGVGLVWGHLVLLATRSGASPICGVGEQSPPLSGDSCQGLRPCGRQRCLGLSMFMSLWDGILGLPCPLLDPHWSSGPRGILGASGEPSGSA